MKLSATRTFLNTRLILAVGAFFIGSAAHASTYSWSAASGLLPNSAGSPWQLGTIATTGAPTLTSDGLLISTTNIREMQYYAQDIVSPSATDVLTFEASLKIISETPTISARAAASMEFTTAPYTGTAIEIGDNEVFWLSSSSTRGGTAFVDTKNSFHTYRIETTGNQPGNLFKVFQDNNLILTGTVPYINSGALIAATHPQLYFGDGTQYSSGTALWRSVSNNLSFVSSVPEPASLALILGGGFLIARVSRQMPSKAAGVAA